MNDPASFAHRPSPVTPPDQVSFTKMMNEYILLIQGNTQTATTDDEWEQFFAAARASGAFRGGSEIGRRQRIGDAAAARPSDHIVGYMRFDTDDKPRLLELLQKHPVVRHGGTVELCELPKS